jgi:hypothetical protein
VEKLRKNLRLQLDAPVRTKCYTILEEGLALAKKRKVPVEVVGHTRTGKSVPAFNWYLRNAMDRGIWVKAPSDETDRTFLFAIADKLGISTTGGKKVGQLRPQIISCFGKGMIEMIIVDEGHFLWPADKKAKPKRLEFLRELFDLHIPSQIAVVILATPQFTRSMNEALRDSSRWAPGQWDGRVIRYHFPDTMSDADLRAVAEHHAPDFSSDMIEKLVMHAKATHGFCGAMVNAIMLAREKAELRGSKRVTAEILREAQATNGRRHAHRRAGKRGAEESRMTTNGNEFTRMKFTPKHIEILKHTRDRAAGGFFCGDSPEMQELVAEGLMVSLVGNHSCLMSILS